jgi:hypothetical protein
MSPPSYTLRTETAGSFDTTVSTSKTTLNHNLKRGKVILNGEYGIIWQQTIMFLKIPSINSYRGTEKGRDNIKL